jgi:hypothetical protein
VALGREAPTKGWGAQRQGRRPRNGRIVTLLIVGLLAAGWLRPLWAALVAVLAVGVAVPILYEAVRPTVCPVGANGTDCIAVSLSAIAALPGLLLVLVGAGVRSVAGLPKVPLLPS